MPQYETSLTTDHIHSSWELLRGIEGTAWGRQISNFLPSSPFLNTGLSSLSVSIKSSRLPPRIGAPPAQRRALGRRFPGKAKVVAKQRPQTLDSLFANMKEQRMRALSQQRNSQRTGGFQQQQRGRGRFSNYSI